MPPPVKTEFNSDVDYRFSNDFGAIRRSKVLRYFQDLTFDEIKNLYISWRDDPEYFGLRITDFYKMPPLSGGGVGIDLLDKYYKFIKVAKRGNDVYKYLVKERLSVFNDLPDTRFFNWGSPRGKTRLVFCTLTYDHDEFDVVRSWLSCGVDFHLFITKVRQEFGDVVFFRSWEAHDDYYCHIHCLLLFVDHEFDVHKHKSMDRRKKGQITYRLQYDVMKKFKRFWPQGNSDFFGLNSVKSGFSEVSKYISKDLMTSKGDKTNSMVWLFGKQSFSVSRRFKDVVCDITDVDSLALYEREMCNCNKKFLIKREVEFLGIFRGKIIGLKSDVWSFSVKDPPPDLSEVIEMEVDRQRALSSGKSIGDSSLCSTNPDDCCIDYDKKKLICCSCTHYRYCWTKSRFMVI